MKPSLWASHCHGFPLFWSESAAMQGGTIGNDAMENIHRYPCKLVQAMAFMSIGGILKNIKSQDEILWKLSSLQRLRVTLRTESVVSSPTALGINCLCTGQCCHGAAMSSLVPCWSQPCLPDLASQLDLQSALSLQIRLSITEQLARPALVPRWGAVGLWLFGDDAAQAVRLSPSAPRSLPFAELPALTTPRHRG